MEREAAFMNDELNRIKQDLKTMEQVIRREPELDRRHVWQGVAFGIWGILYVALGSLPLGMNRFVAAGILVVSLIALPFYLPRFVCGELPPAPSGDKDLNSNSMGLVIMALSMGKTVAAGIAGFCAGFPRARFCVAVFGEGSIRAGDGAGDDGWWIRGRGDSASATEGVLRKCKINNMTEGNVSGKPALTPALSPRRGRRYVGLGKSNNHQSCAALK
jgi:hypothetical protein